MIKNMRSMGHHVEDVYDLRCEEGWRIGSGQVQEQIVGIHALTCGYLVVGKRVPKRACWKLLFGHTASKKAALSYCIH